MGPSWLFLMVLGCVCVEISVPHQSMTPLDESDEGSGLISMHTSVEMHHNNSHVSKDVTVFYHVYLPYPHRDPTQRILQEQVEMIEKSPIYHHIKAVKYTTIHIPVDLHPFCKKCHLVDHYPKGYEMKTLQHVYEHCVAHPTERVVYIHTKGTFHNSLGNKVFRRALMRSVLSEECYKARGKFGCNTCGFRYSPLPHPHFPGDMFAADCEYVSKLIPPNRASRRISVASHHVFGISKAPQKVPHRSGYGVGRYAAEFWIATHPDIVPCDVYGGKYRFAYDDLPKERLFPLDLKGPLRFPISFYRERFKTPRFHTVEHIHNLYPYECAASLHRFYFEMNGRGMRRGSWMHKAYLEDERNHTNYHIYACDGSTQYSGGLNQVTLEVS
ncbi:hypothetical protein AAMO2058_001417700 [Amorphochlora amoebiformis]